MKTVRSLERGIDILLSFTKQRPFQTVEEIARAIDVPRSSVYRFLSSLKNAGLVEQEPQSGRYTLGLKVLELGEIVHGRLELETIAIPFIKKLAHSCGETVELILPYDDHGMCVYAEESSYPLRLSPGKGQRLPLHIGASAQVLLAWLPEEKRDRVLSGPLVRMTPNTICDPQALRERLELIRRQGYMITCGEAYLGSVGIAAPIFDRVGNVAASLSISGPAERMVPEKREQIVRELEEVAAEVSRLLGMR